jgi:hypothetical protein
MKTARLWASFGAEFSLDFRFTWEPFPQRDSRALDIAVPFRIDFIRKGEFA